MRRTALGASLARFARSPDPDTDTGTDNFKAAVLMSLAMVLFAVDDAFTRSVAGQAGAGTLLIFHGGTAALVFGLLVARSGRPITRDILTDPLVVARTVGDLVAAAFFLSALLAMPLANASSILQAHPLVVTLGAALFLGERVLWRRYAGIAVGFLGVLIVIRPGAEGFSAASLYVVLSVLGLALRDLATRRVDSRHSTLAIAFIVSVALVPTGVAVTLVAPGEGTLDAGAVSRILVGSLFGMAGYYAVTNAARYGEVSAIAPFRYVRLVAAAAIGFVVFGERLDAATLFGSLLIVGAGLYTFHRERRQARRSA